MAYKHVIKVNNVCQLLDKSKYSATKTDNGVTYTNNGDGTITVSGTSTESSLYILIEHIGTVGHKYLVYGCPAGSAYTKYRLTASIFKNEIWVDGFSDSGDGNISKVLEEGEEISVIIDIANITDANLVFKPQLFDLTEMFGAGHEPTTVEQFRVNYPNELYPYTPLINLSSNKRMIKVNDVCQLLPISDKEDGVSGGVTFTNNHNGTWTASGISTNNFSYYNIFSIKLIEGHTYLAPSENSVNSTYVEYKFLDNGVPQWGTTVYNAKDKSIIDIGLIRLKGATADPTTCNLQLFDLTEMYGAGNEPATGAEFRQRFPNELYPYSPQCWLTSYKSAVVCKTKNLFDVNNAVPYDFSTDNYDSNLVWLKDGIYTTRMNNYNLGRGLRIKNGLSLPAGKYTLSVRLVDFYNADRFVLGMRCKNTEGKWVDWSWGFTASEHKGGDILTFANTLPENTDLRLYLCYQNDNGQYLTGYVSYKDIQLEQGTTATSYVPYQHL